MSSYKGDRVRCTVRLPTNLMLKLESLANSNGTSLNELVTAGLERVASDPEIQRATRSPNSPVRMTGTR